MVRKILYFMTIAAMLGLLIIGCEDKNEGIQQIQIVDVSSRITGVPAFSGAGAEIEIQGTRLEEVERIIFGVYVVRKIEIDTTDTGISFIVPGQVGVGENEVVLVFPGNERAFTTITILARQVISYFDPTNGDVGDTIAIHGNNLYVIDEVSIGGVIAEIIDQDTTVIHFTVPSNAYSDVITTTSGAGIATSNNIFHACETAEGDVRCMTNVINGGDFEYLPLGVFTGDAIIFPQGSPNFGTYEVIESIGYPDMGEKSLKITVIATGQTWEPQLVFNQFPVTPGRRWLYTGKIWANASGWQVKVTGGTGPVDGVGSYTNMQGAVDITLNQGWNEFEAEIWHDVYGIYGTPQPDNQIRPMITMGYAQNVGAVIIFEDFRIVDIGPR